MSTTPVAIMETPVEEVEVTQTMTYRFDGDMVCQGSGATAQEAREAAFQHARQQVIEWKKRAADLALELEVMKNPSTVDTEPSTEPQLGKVEVASLDMTRSKLPMHTAVVGLEGTGRTSIVADMIHSMRHRFTTVTVLTNVAVSKAVLTRMNAGVSAFSLETLEAHMKMSSSLNHASAIVIESDVFACEYRYSTRFASLLESAASFNVSLFCIASGNSIPCGLISQLGVVAITCGSPIVEHSTLYRSKFAPLFARFADFSFVYQTATQKRGSCLVSVGGEKVCYMPGSDKVPDWMMEHVQPSSAPSTDATSSTTVEATNTTEAAVPVSDWITNIDKSIANLAQLEREAIPPVRDLSDKLITVLRQARDKPATSAHAMGTLFRVLGVSLLWYADVKGTLPRV